MKTLLALLGGIAVAALVALFTAPNRIGYENPKLIGQEIVQYPGSSDDIWNVDPETGAIISQRV